jgi:hypothetical protein
LIQAIASFEDAFLALEAVANPKGYHFADKTHPHDQKHRVDGCPKDSFHLACEAHRTRIKNTLRAPGINMIEKAVFKQRIVNMRTAQNSYLVL